MIAGRRNVLALAGAAATLGAAKASPSPPPPPKLDLTDPAARLRSFMLMRGALDGRLVIGFVNARYYGVVETQMQPIFGVLGATFSRYRPAADGGYEGVTYEVPYFTDLTTGEAMDHFKNPYTGETVAVPQKASKPARIKFGPDLTFSLPDAPPSVSVHYHVPPATQYGADVWMLEDSTTTIQFAPGSKPIQYSEIVTLHALAADLQAPGAKHVGALTGYQSISNWRSWMKMPDHPGHISATGFGRYGASLADLPPGWLNAARLRHPHILADPAALLDKA